MNHLTTKDPDALAEACLGELLACVPADIAMWFNQGTLRGRTVVRRIYTLTPDQSALPVDLQGFVGGPEMGGSAFDTHEDLVERRKRSWTIEAPASKHLNRFSLYSDDYTNTTFDGLKKEGETVGVHSIFYAPLEIGDQVRALVYQGNRLLGLFGLYRRGLGERFTPKERDLLNTHAGRFAQRLSVIEALTVRDEPDDIEHVVFDASLGVQWASPRARAWLDPRRTDALRRRLRGEPSGWVLDNVVCVRVGMALRGHGAEHLVTLEPTRAVMLSPLRGLPAQTQRFAQLLVTGLTLSEIARRIGCSRSTLYAHRDRLFRALDVHDTLSLAARLASLT